MSQSQPTRSGTPQAQPIIIIAITLFAFSGLMVGFTVGAFSHFKPYPNATNQAPVAANHITPTSIPTPSPTPLVVRLGVPDLTVSNSTANPDGTQTYNVSIQAKDQNNTAKVTADGITCRIWLVATDNDPNADLRNDAAQLQHPETFSQQQFPHEVQGALTFNPTTTGETQQCVQGAAHWTFTISPSVPKGGYFLVGLTDWQGQRWNWTARQITVR
jgi:hypothetical protein